MGTKKRNGKNVCVGGGVVVSPAMSTTSQRRQAQAVAATTGTTACTTDYYEVLPEVLGTVVRLGPQGAKHGGPKPGLDSKIAKSSPRTMGTRTILCNVRLSSADRSAYWGTRFFPRTPYLGAQ